MSGFFEIPQYHRFLPPDLARSQINKAKPVPGCGLLQIGPLTNDYESANALAFVESIYKQTKYELEKILSQREKDREFLDARVRACYQFNLERGHKINSDDYQTVIGLKDENDREVMGPLTDSFASAGETQVAPIPEYLKGPHVTLFGPPDSAKMAINAMNAWHRISPKEPAVVSRLLESSSVVAKWGADDEDSKTPLRVNLADAGYNLSRCYDGTLNIEGNSRYVLAQDRLSLPIKRFPGLALPCTFLFSDDSPIPLHLYDFALHMFNNWNNAKALTFYVPKLENEEEAIYIHKMIETTEMELQKLHPEYKSGTVRVLIVLENPRAILRTHEIIDALYPYFVGASLGWHDYLASMARLMREDGNYRIPVKADPNIVVKHIRESHLHLARVVGSRGGICIGGMYGVLPRDNDPDSLQITLRGFFVDVLTQLKRKLDGFWVAHPDFVRLGLAMVEAYRLYQNGQPAAMEELISSYLNEKNSKEVINLLNVHEDHDEQYRIRSLIVADILESDFVPNNAPEEIRYNVFQTLQYLTDWLCGNGCVALPAHIDGIPVRVMDDLATAERSRWEVWHEIRHGRFSLEEFLTIAHEELRFIRQDRSTDTKAVQVKWNDKTAKWYPIAFRLMIRLMTDPEPPEFATELLLPWTIDGVRTSMPEVELPQYIERFLYYFERCGCQNFAHQMAQELVFDRNVAKSRILRFDVDEVIEAASFHGNIGESKATLDERAKAEQAAVLADQNAVRKKLLKLGSEYLEKFGFKFLIAAKGKSSDFLLQQLEQRMNNTPEQELNNARDALWKITRQRIENPPCGSLFEKIEKLQSEMGIDKVGWCLIEDDIIQDLGCKELFQIASLSKTPATAWSMEYFKRRFIPLDTVVDELLEKSGTDFRLDDPQVKLEHLMSHTALNLHYVIGASGQSPSLRERLLDVHSLGSAGKEFHYSGGGFLVLQHLIETLEKKPLEELISSSDFDEMSFDPQTPHVTGRSDQGEEYEPLKFPQMAAGVIGSAAGMARFVIRLGRAYHQLDGDGFVSHETAVRMLHGRDLGARDFMGADCGLGVFVAESGRNRWMLHQGANDGFRCIYLYCFDGPDRGRGTVMFCNADNQGMLFIARAVQLILKVFKPHGVRLEKLESEFDYSAVEQEKIVNLGYKNLILTAFEQDLPEAIELLGEPHELAGHNLVAGAEIQYVSNQKFARAENLLKLTKPVFDPRAFGRQGKIMDSWESARHNPAGEEEMIFKLAKPGTPVAIEVSTEFHDGNHAEWIQIEGRSNPGEPWQVILPKSPLSGHSIHRQMLPAAMKAEWIRVSMGPDGGVTRLGLFDQPCGFSKDWHVQRMQHGVPQSHKPKPIPFVAENLTVESVSNQHYGPAEQLASPFPPIHMFDGLESARSREEGHFEQVVLKHSGTEIPQAISLDFTFFRNNNPVKIALDDWQGEKFEQILTHEVKAYAGNQVKLPWPTSRPLEKLRLRIFPDGGVHRVRLHY